MFIIIIQKIQFQICKQLLYFLKNCRKQKKSLRILQNQHHQKNIPHKRPYLKPEPKKNTRS